MEFENTAIPSVPNTEVCPLENAAKQAMIKRVDEFIKTVRSQIGTIEKLYKHGKTGSLLKERKTTLEAFRKNVSRMREGTGLFNDPILLAAILEDTGYPAQALFSDETTPLVNMNLVLGPGSVESLENIIYRAVQEAQKTIIRTAKLNKRLKAAQTVLMSVQFFAFTKNYTMAISLFLFHSRNNPQLYRHNEDKRLSQIDKLIVFIVKNLLSSSVEKNNNFGKLLSLAYIVFEITQICKSLNNYTDRKARNVLSRRTKYKGFVYPANYSRKELENNINMINDTMEKIIDLAIKKNDIDITDSVCPIGTSIKVLYKLLTGNIKMEFLQETISLEDVIKAFLFNSENHPVIRPQYAWKIDNDFILAFSKLGELITKLNEININPPIDKSGIEKDSNILCNSEDDRFDLHLWP